MNAQTQTISVNGQARCGTEKVVGALVTLLQPTDSSIVAYTTTDKQGFYTLKATTQLSEVLLSISGFNIKRKTTRIKAHSQTFDFHVKEENRILRESWLSRKTVGESRYAQLSRFCLHAWK